MKTKETIENLLQDKNVLYVATKNGDYLRVQQDIDMIEKYANSIDKIISFKKNYFFRLLYVYMALLLNFKNYDIVYIGFAPQIVVPFFSWKFRNQLMIVDVFISIYDTFILDRQTFKEKSIVARFLKYLDITTFKYADIVVCDTYTNAEYFVHEFYLNQAKVHIIYFIADSRYYFPKTYTKPKEIQHKYVVLYFGSILPLQGVDIILDAIQKIDEDEIHFILIGPINKDVNLKNTTIIKWLSQNMLADYIAFSDLCLAGHFNPLIGKAKRGIPGKAYIYEAMHKRFILGENRANRERYPENYKNIAFVPMGNSDALAIEIVKEYNRANKVQYNV